MPEIHLRTTTHPCYAPEIREIAHETLSAFGQKGFFAMACPIETIEDDDDPDTEPQLGRRTLIYRDLDDDIEISEIDSMSITKKMKFGGPSFVLLSEEGVSEAATAAFKDMIPEDSGSGGVLIAFRDGLLVMTDSIWIDIIDAVKGGAELQNSADHAVRIIVPEGLSAHRRLPFVQEACAFIEAVLKIEAEDRKNNKDIEIIRDVTVRAQ